MGNISMLLLPSPRFPLHPRGKIPQRTQSVMSCGEKDIGKEIPQYLAELLKKKKNTASGAGGGSGIFVIELNTFLNRSWIYDTGCGTHICNTTQGLRASRKLKPGALSLYVGNGQREAVEAIGNFDLSLPLAALVILLNPTWNVFSMKDFRRAAYILGIKIYGYRSRRFDWLMSKVLISIIFLTDVLENIQTWKYHHEDKLRLSKSLADSYRIPGDLSWTTVMNILKYSGITKDMTGYVFVLNGGAVDWKECQAKHFRYFICRKNMEVYCCL
ncbi:hypothetical protein Tco_0803019 [Tanacetum coccineum]|uniref:Uncharacterized protein n=1 Tax=Tanacetum coccineum TaxID=301880 RepID=A0ABQ5A373_9ASTR